MVGMARGGCCRKSNFRVGGNTPGTSTRPALLQFVAISQADRVDPGVVYSIGLQLGSDGQVNDSIVGSPAFEAGISSGMKVIGVNGRVYKPELLEDAIKASKETSQAISLLVVVDEYYRTCTINYKGGARYPHLVRDEGKPDDLDQLIKARAGQ